jgi:HAE1 family hydrophobic/amphiphilic exporter-1
MNLALGGPLPPRELTRLADDVVKARLQTLQDVGSVELIGDQEREFHVWLHPDALEQYGLAAADVVQAIGAQNVEVPGGRLQTGTRELSVKTRGQVHTAAEIGALVIPTMSGPPIRVRDVATVEDGEEERRSIATLDGEPAVALVIRKQSGSNTVEVAHRVHKAVEELRAELPAGVVLAAPIDNSTFIEASIGSVKFDLLFGGILAVLIILFFLRDWRATVISSLALPASVIATFAAIGTLDFTFNNMTMLALTLSIGILIDDAIVVIENIHRHLQMGKPPRQAAADAHQRDRPRGHGYHRLHRRGVSAGRRHEGHHRPLLSAVRHHRRLRGHRLALRGLHHHAGLLGAALARLSRQADLRRPHPRRRPERPGPRL